MDGWFVVQGHWGHKHTLALEVPLAPGYVREKQRDTHTPFL